MARSFNGSSDLIDLSMPAADTSTVINCGAWFKTSGNGALLCSDNGSGAGRVLQFKVLSGKIQWLLGSSGTLHTINGAVTVNDGKWHHACGSFDGTTMRLYVDGVADGTLTTGATNTFASRNARIGAQISGVTQAFFAGNIAEVFVRYTALTLADAKTLAAGIPASFLNPDHYWPLWGVDSPEPDIGIG